MGKRSELLRGHYSKIKWHARKKTLIGYLKVIGVFAVFIAIMTFAFYLCERNEGGAMFHQPRAETIWKIVVYFFTGFADDPPQTVPGRFIAVAVFIVGIALVATLTGRIASYFVRKEMGIVMPKNISEHIVVCNWNERADRIVSELHSPQGIPDAEIVVIAPTEVNSAEFKGRPEFDNVTFINSDPSFHDILRICNAHRARSVILIADEEHHPDDPDGNSALIALAIHRLCDNEDFEPPHIVAEALDHRRIQHLKDAGVNEVVCAQDFGLGILAQSSIHQGLSEVYNRLLTYSDATNEIYIIEDIPPGFIGKTFQEASLAFSRNRSQENPAILIGIKRGDQMHLNARHENDECVIGGIKEGDNLIVIAFDPPDLHQFNGELLLSSSE